MNRIHSLLLSRFTSTPELDGNEMPTVSPSFSYSVFSPLHYEANYAYPLLVWLHSEGEDETQIQRLMPHISLRNSLLLAPQPTSIRGSSANDRGSSAASKSSQSWLQSQLAIDQTERLVLDCIEVASKRFNISLEKVFVAGYGSGGTMALRMGLNYAFPFAGAISINGRLPAGCEPFARLNDVRDLPLLLVQGEQSTAYPTEQTCRDLRLLHSAGMSVDLRQYPCDDLHTQMLHDMNVWIMNRFTSVIS